MGSIKGSEVLGEGFYQGLIGVFGFRGWRSFVLF